MTFSLIFFLGMLVDWLLGKPRINGALSGKRNVKDGGKSLNG
jgi:hypothetical protein